jgi:hypothetical protein
MIVSTRAVTIATAAAVGVLGAVTLSPVILTIPTITSFQISAMMKPNAAAIATAIVLLISFMVTIFHLPTGFLKENILELYNNYEKNRIILRG